MSFFRAHPLSATVLRLGDVEALQQSDFNPSLPTNSLLMAGPPVRALPTTPEMVKQK